MALIWNGASVSIEQVGGKGYNLLRLYHATQEPDSIFDVPKFFVIPIGESSYTAGNSDVAYMKNDAEVREAFSRLKTPVIVRSSSVLEDSVKASFAGVFHSELYITDYQGLLEASNKVLDSQFNDFARKVARERKIEWREGMAIIVQEQVIAPDFKGTFQIDDKIIVEGEEFGKPFRDKEDFDERAYGDFDALEWILEKDRSIYLNSKDYMVMESAIIQARKKLQLSYPLQAELCYNLGRKPQLVQIRQLPLIDKQDIKIEFNVPPNVPAIYSTRCNGIAGEVVLPAYVTLSPSGAEGLIIKFNLSNFLDDNPKKDEFENQSKLAHNRDFREYLGWVRSGFDYDNRMIRADYLFEMGNQLFPEYALVCDQLNDTRVGMNHLTTNKKAIIATYDFKQISHALTVSRELGIIGMISDDENMSDLGMFLHQIQTGDLIHIKSDGKQGVAYLEKRRDSDPYRKK